MDTNAYLMKTFEGFSLDNLQAMMDRNAGPMFWAGLIVVVIIAVLIAASSLHNSPTNSRNH